MKGKSKIFIAIASALLALFLIVLIVGNVLAFGVFADLLTLRFGTSGGTAVDYDTNQYFERKTESAEAAALQAAALSEEIEGEGIVLLRNNGALPLSPDCRVSCFSQSSVDFIYGSFGGSGAIDTSKVDTLKTALEAKRITVNPLLWNFYVGRPAYRRVTGGLAGGTSKNPNRWAINEVPYSAYPDNVIASYREYSDAAIVVISRTGCENGDLPTDLSYWDKSNSGSILELDATERELLKNVRGNFGKVIVLLNTGNAMECGFLEEFGIDACLWVGGVGQYGLAAVADALLGNINPSGRAVDTYAYDAFSSPAMQNWGNFAYVQGRSETGHHYVAYSEGVYVGYKYYETRYEDRFLAPDRAGDFDYAKTVQFPFGYGLSYTTFAWSGFSAKKQGDDIEIKVTVKNMGDRTGKDVVEVYYQSPYTDYDRRNRIEKPSVKLGAFFKTDALAPGDSQEVTLVFPIEQMKSYDAYGKGTYTLESSEEYFVTAARDAHAAIDNILSAKGYRTAGDAAFARKLSFPEETYRTDSYSGNEVTNLFDGCEGEDVIYLSRSDWRQMDENGLRYGTPFTKDGDGQTYCREIAPELKAELERVGYEASGAPQEEFSMPTVNSMGDLSLIQLKGKDFDDAGWDLLLDQVTVQEMVRLAKLSGYKMDEMTSVGKPYATDADGPSAWNSFIGNGLNAGGFPYEVVLASTWNSALAERMGDAMGELCLWAKITNHDSAANLTGWYAPAMNLHRTPFGGRNFEYYSEDETLSAKIGAATVKGATARGVICYIKHFAFNEQETNRMTDNVVWSREQALRELYLKPFETAIKEGGSLGLMTAYNRIGTTWVGGSYALLTGLLRNEWNFRGVVVSDYMDGDYENVDQMLAAGGDAALNPVNNQKCTSDTAQALTYLRRATKHCLYATANSNAMNGIDGAVRIVGETPRYHTYMILIDVGLGLLSAACVVWIVLIRTRAKRMGKAQ